MFKTSLACLFALFVSAAPIMAQQHGAIYTTDRFGNHVDGNYFLRAGSIYLVGGPVPGQPCSSPGLDDGDYYFEVTDTAGSQLLSPDAIEDRRVRVIGGVIAAYLGTTHLAGGTGPCGSVFLQLMPFTTTPSTGDEFKVWMTRVGDYDPNGSGFFGFLPGKSKSENFKLRTSGPIVAQSVIRGHVFYDYDESAAWNPNTEPLEVPIGGWRVEIVQNNVIQGVTFTDQDGLYVFIREHDGAARILREKAPGGYVGDDIPGAAWVATTPRSVTVTTSTESVAGPEFGNLQFELIVGGGRPADFWAEDCDSPQCPSGKLLLEAADPEWRHALCTHAGSPVSLRRPISCDNPFISIFILPPLPICFEIDFAIWRNYVHRESHDHAGFLLSREVAAAILNNQFGFIQGSLLIDRHQDGVLVPFEEMLTGAIELLNEDGAGLTGPNDPFQALRAMMLMCVNEFGSINNTGDLSTPQVVYTRSHAPPASISVPYN